MPGQPGHSTRPHARSPPSFQGMDAWMTSQLNVDFVTRATLGHWCAWLIFLTLYPLDIGYDDIGILINYWRERKLPVTWVRRWFSPGCLVPSNTYVYHSMAQKVTIIEIQKQNALLQGF